MRALAWVLALGLVLPSFPVGASAGHSHSSSSSSSKSKSTKSSSKKSTKCATCPRDSHGKIKRSAQAKEDFMRATGYAHGRKGYVVDHFKPLECGGADAPSNMQWQTAAAAKAKDRTERNCR